MLHESDLVLDIAPLDTHELVAFFRDQSAKHQPNAWAVFYEWTERHQILCLLAWAIVFNMVRPFMPEDQFQGSMVPIWIASAVVFLPILIAHMLTRPGAEWYTREIEPEDIDERTFAMLGGKKRCKCLLSSLMLPIGRGMETPLAEVTWLTIVDAGASEKELTRRGMKTWVHVVEI